MERKIRTHCKLIDGLKDDRETCQSISSNNN